MLHMVGGKSPSEEYRVISLYRIYTRVSLWLLLIRPVSVYSILEFQTNQHIFKVDFTYICLHVFSTLNITSVC